MTTTPDLRTSHHMTDAQIDGAGAEQDTHTDHGLTEAYPWHVGVGQTTHHANSLPEPMADPRGGQDHPTSQLGHDAHTATAGGVQAPEQASGTPKPISEAPVRAQDTAPTIVKSEPKDQTSVPSAAPNGHRADDTHGRIAIGGSDPVTPATLPPEPTGVALGVADKPVSQPDQGPSGTHARIAVLADPLLDIAADILDDLERTRISNENRLRALIRDVEDKDGKTRGYGMLPVEFEELPRKTDKDWERLWTRLWVRVHATLADSDGKPTAPPGWEPEVWALALLVLGLRGMEHEAELNLKRQMRKHPLGWIAKPPAKGGVAGPGEKQLARLLAAVGDPYWHDKEDRMRRVSELWQYAGHGDPKRSRRVKGQKGLGHSPTAKMRTYLIAESAVKAGIRKLDDAPAEFTPETRKPISRYGHVYYDRRVTTWERTHAEPCVRCGPKGNPAEPGTPWSDGHKQADALRIVGKEILRDLWIEARSIHHGGGPD